MNNREEELRKQRLLKNEAKSLTTAELLRSLSWNEALNDHYAEIGGREGSSSSRKSEIIKEELRNRGVR